MGELVVPDYEPQALPPLSDAGAAGAAAGASSSDFAGMTPAKPTVTVLGRRVSATQFKAGVAVASGLLVLLVVASVSSAATGSGNGTVTGSGNDSATGNSNGTTATSSGALAVDSASDHPSDPLALLIKGVVDIQTPQGGTSGKAIQLLAVGDVPDLSLYGLGIANNGGGTDGMEVENLPAVRLRAGATFWVLRERALDHAGVNPFAAYFGGDSVFATGTNGVDFHIDHDISMNGNDAVELFFQRGQSPPLPSPPSLPPSACFPFYMTPLSDFIVKAQVRLQVEGRWPSAKTNLAGSTHCRAMQCAAAGKATTATVFLTASHHQRW